MQPVSIQTYVLFFSTLNFILFFINVSLMMHTNRLRKELIAALNVRKENKVLKFTGHRRRPYWRNK